MPAVPHGLVEALQASPIFKNWQSKHLQAFLSHLFCRIDAQGQLQSSWEIGYFLPELEKIAIFVQETEQFSLKPEDDVFKQPDAAVEELQLDAVNLSFLDAVQRWKEELPKAFPKEQAGNGFVILQTFQQQTIWNFSVLAASLQFLNMKIDAVDGTRLVATALQVVSQERR